jgi:hypothetical protein
VHFSPGMSKNHLEPIDAIVDGIDIFEMMSGHVPLVGTAWHGGQALGNAWNGEWGKAGEQALEAIPAFGTTYGLTTKALHAAFDPPEHQEFYGEEADDLLHPEQKGMAKSSGIGSSVTGALAEIMSQYAK